MTFPEPSRSAGLIASTTIRAPYLSAVAAVQMLLLLCCTVAGLAAAQPVVVTDDRGVAVRLAQPARRIVTLTPHLTELVYAAGAGARLVGVARYSDYPAAARALPVVGDVSQIDAERLLQLRPDLVLAWQGGTPPDAVARLERAGLTVYVSAVARLQDIGRGLVAIADLAGTAAAGHAAAAAFAQDLGRLQARTFRGPPVRVFYEIWPQPLMTVNQSHVISDVIALCGGRNVFGEQLPLTPEISREALLAADPEVALGGGSADTAAGYAARWAALPPPLNRLPAYFVPPDLIQRPTPRLIQGATAVCTHLDAVRARRR